MKKLLMMIGAAAMLPFATSAAWSETVYTYQSNGVEWRFLIGEDTHTAMLGTCGNATGSLPSGMTAQDASATTQPLSGIVILPEAFTVNGVSYRVTTIGNRALSYSRDSGNLTSITFPSGAHNMYQALFYNFNSISNICFKGPLTVAAGTQEQLELKGNGINSSSSSGTPNLKTVFVGPNFTKGSNTIEFKRANGCTYFFPKYASGTQWSNNSTYVGSNANVIYYGPEEELDFTMGETTLTATVRTANALTNVLNHVAIFKNDFGLDTKINVTNTIEVAADLITVENMQYATFNSLMLKVATQAQLTSILSVIPASVPFVIDASDAKEELTLPQGREIYVRVSGEGRNGKYRPKVNGLIISFF